jgi:hypothetical protein
LPWWSTVRGLKPNWFTDARVTEIDGGYTMEVWLGNVCFIGDGQWLAMNAKGVYGFDVAVNEGDETAVAQQVWRGDARNVKDTSHFGTIVLTGEPAVRQ